MKNKLLPYMVFSIYIVQSLEIRSKRCQLIYYLFPSNSAFKDPYEIQVFLSCPLNHLTFLLILDIQDISGLAYYFLFLPYQKINLVNFNNLMAIKNILTYVYLDGTTSLANANNFDESKKVLGKH